MRDHELRYVLNDELHGRPGLPVTAPCRITHLAFTIAEGDADPLAHVKLLRDAPGAKPPADGVPHHTGIARDVEEISSRTSYRYAAARAYAALVDKRIMELGEQKVMSFQRIGVFLDRRFGPVMATCTATAERLRSLAERSERASNLLRTRVDIALEAQNQQLLKSMEKRGHQQLRLQETIEGLSVVAISYYLLGIVSKLLEGLGGYAQFDAKLLSLISIPVVVALVWYGVRRLRRRILKSVRK